MDSEPSPMFKHSIYLLLRVARKRAEGVIIENAALKQYLRKKPGERPSRPKVHDLADKFRPIFPSHQIAEDYKGLMILILYLNSKASSMQDRRLITLSSRPKSDEIEKELGLNF